MSEYREPRVAGGGVRRFKSYEVDPSRAHGLRPDHPAIVEGRTVYPSTVVDARTSPRLLVSGVNNTKLGGKVRFGPRKGWPIYQLTLEERATCPRSCAHWGDCYGNAMHRARRHSHHGTFMLALQGEIEALAEKHPDGFLVRLHTLGEFFSVGYVTLWKIMLERHPNLHVFGYTSRRLDDQTEPMNWVSPGQDTRRIADAIERVRLVHWERFAIRTSHVQPGWARAVVYDKDPEREDVVMCPEQRGATQACATCGLCWASAAKDKTIGFLRHGMKR